MRRPSDSVKAFILRIYRRLPFPVAVALSRIKPDLAFYIKAGPRDLVINDYLGEFRVNIDTHSDIERRMLARRYEPQTLSVIETLVRPGHVCFDIGANIGAITLALAKAVGANGRVVSFEPGPPLFERLTRNLALNPSLHGRVQPHRLGLSDAPGELFWQASRTDPGNATIHWADPSQPGTKVEVSTIDAFVAAQGITALHFLKVDVEGMERRVLSGGLETIRRFQPAIFFETTLCDDEQKREALAIQELLASLGYHLYKITDDSGTLRRTAYPDLSDNTVAPPSIRRARLIPSAFIAPPYPQVATSWRVCPCVGGLGRVGQPSLRGATHLMMVGCADFVG